MKETMSLECPYIIDSVLFSLRVRKHKSTGFSPFSLFYQREAVLPIDLDCNLIDFSDDNALSNDDSSNKKIISETFHAMNKMKNELFDEAYQNIEKSQKRQKLDYNRRIAPNYEIRINKKVLLRNSRRDDRKGGKLVKPWTGPYTVTSILSTNNSTLKNLKGLILKITKNIFTADINLLSCPKQLHSTIGDGNCFFRAISYIITGSESSYEIIREKVVRHMCTHINDKMTSYVNKSVIAYLNESGMSDNTTWATDAEIIGCASFIGME